MTAYIDIEVLGTDVLVGDVMVAHIDERGRWQSFVGAETYKVTKVESSTIWSYHYVITSGNYSMSRLKRIGRPITNINRIVCSCGKYVNPALGSHVH